MKAAYLTGKDLAIYSVANMLNERYGRENVVALPASQLGSADLSNFDLLVFPGCTGEISPYPEFFTSEAYRNFDNAVQNGLAGWKICAATYSVMDRFKYLSSSGEFFDKDGFGWVNGEAHGPIEGPAIAPSKEDRFCDVVLRRVFYECASGEKRNADLCYGNGAGIFLSETELKNPDTKIMARFGTHGEGPIAALTKKYGQGMFVCLSVLPEISPADMQGDTSDANMGRHRRSMREHLEKTDYQRKDFLNGLFRVVENHVINLKMIKSHQMEMPHVRVA